MSLVVGIDLGTTNSLVAVVRDGVPEILPTREGRRLLPSVLAFSGPGVDPVLGYAARGRGAITSAKRLVGRTRAELASIEAELPYRLGEEDGQLLIEVPGRDLRLSPVDVSARILRELKLSAEAALGQPVERAVVTVPAYFNDAQRQATRLAGRLAGLDVLRILNEPTAAALAYGLDRKREGVIAVYDLGGGTFDISILKLHDGIFQVLSTAGDTQLGGDDLDRALAEGALARSGAVRPADPAAWAALLAEAERVKIALTDAESVELRHAGAALRVTRADFAAWAAPILARTSVPCERALADAGLRPEDLTDVVLVGGPTRLAAVREQVRAIFGREPSASVHPDEVVALGAAIQADVLGGSQSDVLLLDVTPLSLGIETYGGGVSVLLPRNSRLPAVARETFTTFVDHQTAVDVHVVQGESEACAENRSLSRFKLRVEPQPAGLPRVEVTFLIDADGILQVSAKDLQTGALQSIEARPSVGLGAAEVERLVARIGAGGGEARRWIEARNRAETLLRATEKALPDAPRLLPAAEADRVAHYARKLRAKWEATARPDVGAEEIEALDELAFTLDQATQRLAELRVADAAARG